MIPAIVTVAIVSAGVAFALWVYGLGGSAQFSVGEFTFGPVPFHVAALLAGAAVIVIHLLLRALGFVFGLPAAAVRASRERRRADGEAATTRALSALAARSGETARTEAARARRLLGDTPQLLLLAAQAERMSGRLEAAEDAYRALAERKDGRFLGLQGLLREAMENNNHAAALILAREAEAAYPAATWLRQERVQLALRQRDWREALSLAPPDTPRAPLALAAAGQEPNPARAADYERRAFEADRGFAPAALAHAKRLREAGNARQARAVLEASWVAAPNPDVGRAYFAAAESPVTAVREAEALVRRNPSHSESRLLIAGAALTAGMYPRARTELEALVAGRSADRRAYELLASLEEAQGGDSEETRAAQAKWLREADAAPPAPVWRCANCGAVHEEWMAECPSCGAVGQIGYGVAAPEVVS